METFDWFDSNRLLYLLTGALQTANRLYKAGLVDSPKRPFCGADEETIQHLSHNCQGVSHLLGQPTKLFPDQPHFFNRTVCSPSPRQKSAGAGGGGSVVNGDHLFSKTAGLALIDDAGEVVFSTGFPDRFGCSFKAELLALVAAIRTFQGDLLYITDCKAVFNIWQTLSKTGRIPLNLAYRDLWLEIFQSSLGDHSHRLQVTWARAHQVDSVAPVQDKLLLRNKLADIEAKKSAMAACPLQPRILQSRRQHLLIQRTWLCRLAKLIADQRPPDDQTSSGEGDPDNQQPSRQEGYLLNRFGKWDWRVPQQIYEWKFQCGEARPPPIKWKFSSDTRRISIDFLKSLQWRIGDTGGSIWELGFLYWRQQRQLPAATGKNTTGSFMVIIQWLRVIFRGLHKLGLHPYPAEVQYQTRKRYSLTRNFPLARLTVAESFFPLGFIVLSFLHRQFTQWRA